MPDVEPTLDLPPTLVACEFQGVRTEGREACEAFMLGLEESERDRVILILSNGFSSYWSKFTSGEDEPWPTKESKDAP